MKLERILDSLHARARRSQFLHRFTAFNRALLAIGFFAPGIVKATGNRFTVLGLDSPVGFFFEAMYRTGGYWRFIGLSQILASILILIPRTATLGAAIFFPIILNIFIITVSMDFAGTPVITGSMLLAVTYLLCWDYPKFKPLFFHTPAATLNIEQPQMHRLERLGYLMAALGGMSVMLTTRGWGRLFIYVGLGVGLLGGLLALAGWIWEARGRSRHLHERLPETV